MGSKYIDTDKFSKALRAKAIDVANRCLLVTNFQDSKQEQDLTEPPNCAGFGRIRHFRLSASQEWPKNPLPIEPASKALRKDIHDELRAQVFQNAACNWRCWYCYVDFALLSADPKWSAFLTPNQLIDLYLEEPNRPQVIDLTGGQPDLVPEWVPWMMDELRNRGLENDTYLWSDDNLSNDYFWRYLSREEIDLVCSYPNYGKVCCFKGFDETSFSFNTQAAPELHDRQFDLMRRLLTLGLDIYCYATFTSSQADGIADRMAIFVDKLQQLDPNLPLRTVPLEINIYGSMKARFQNVSPETLAIQRKAVEVWNFELSKRFSTNELARNIVEVPLKSRPAAKAALI